MNGAKRTTEAMDCKNLRIFAVVEERSTAVRLTVRIAGCCRSENVGISNEKIGEIPVRRKSKVSDARSFRVGLVGSLAEAERRR